MKIIRKQTDRIVVLGVLFTLAGLCPAPIRDPRGMNQKPVPEATEAQLQAQQNLVKTQGNVGIVNMREGDEHRVKSQSSDGAAAGELGRANDNLDGTRQATIRNLAEANETAKRGPRHNGANLFYGVMMLLFGLGVVQLFRSWASKGFEPDGTFKGPYA